MLLLILFITGALGFTCLENPKILKYANSDDLLSDDLPTVRILSPGYSSQAASNFLGYTYLKEYVGLNVEMYPIDVENCPKFLSNWHLKEERACTLREVECRLPNRDFNCEIENITYCNCNEIEKEMGKDCYIYADYYFSLIANNLVDLHLEFWTFQAFGSNAIENFISTRLIEATPLGIFGEIGWFVPTYVFEDYPDFILPHSLLNDKELREYIYNGSKGNYGTIDYIEYYSDLNNLEENYKWQLANYTYTDDDVPVVVWGSFNDYFQSNFSYYRGLNYNLTFVAVGSEIELAKIVEELYNARAPFIANVYVPDDNFATLDKNGNLFEFEKVALPFNKAQSYDAECFVNDICAHPLDILRTMINPVLKDSLPELFTFFNKYLINAEQIAEIQSNYRLLSNNLTESERWLKASCEFTKNNQDLMSDWDPEIIRFKCLDGCGFMDNGKEYGATCDTNTGKCVCNVEELVGETCRNGCQGVIIINNTLNFCNGNGVCDTKTYECSCKKGYGGKDCNKKAKLFKYSIYVFYIILSVLLFIMVINGYLFYKNKFQYIHFHMSLFLLLCSGIFNLFEYTNATCIIQNIFFNFGRGLLIIPLIKDTYLMIKNKHPESFWKEVIIVETFISCLYILIFLLTGGTNLIYDNLVIYKTCNLTLIQIQYIYTIILSIIVIFYSSILRRNIQNTNLLMFKKTTCNYIGNLIAIFILILTFIFTLTQNQLLKILLYDITVFILCIISLGLYYQILYNTNEYEIYEIPNTDLNI